MRFRKFSRALAGVAVLTVASAAASADVWNKKTNLTVNETIEVPGAVLPPGKYVVKLVDSQSNRHIVQFLNEDEDEVLSTVIAIPNTRLEPTGDTEFGWYETPAGQPPALRAWFYPGDNFGQEFAYPGDRATALSQSTQQEVARVSDDDQQIIANREQTDETVVAQAPAPQPQPDPDQRQAAQAEQAERDRERELAAQRERDMQAQRDREMQAQRERELAAQRERELAQAQAQQQAEPDPSLTAQAPAEPAETELPDTAGFGGLLALIGLGSLGASAAVRKLRR